LTDPPEKGVEAPDWFYMANVPPMLDGEVRRSYVLWKEIATSTLGELASRNSSVAAKVAWEILSDSRGDRYLQAAALETLFQGNRELALDYMSQHAWDCERYLLNTIMELMIENSSDFQSNLALSVSSIVHEQIKKMNNQEEFIAPEVIDSFLNLYCEAGNFQAVTSTTLQGK
jgi:hypothetical protein